MRSRARLVAALAIAVAVFAGSRDGAAVAAARRKPPPAPVASVAPSKETLARQTVEAARARLAEDVEKARGTRLDRKRARLEELRERYHDVLGAPGLRSELRVHADRLARLHRLKALAKAELRSDVRKKVAVLTMREQTRHLLVVQALPHENDDAT